MKSKGNNNKPILKFVVTKMMQPPKRYHSADVCLPAITWPHHNSFGFYIHDDVIVLVVMNSTTNLACCSDFVIQFPNITNDNNQIIHISINGLAACPSTMNMKLTNKGGCQFVNGNSLMKPPSAALSSLVMEPLQRGQNTLRYLLLDNLCHHHCIPVGAHGPHCTV
jgi:hypothetical protein